MIPGWLVKLKLTSVHIDKPLPPNFEAENDMKLSESTKFLGTHLDGKLLWNRHIDHVCSKLYSAVFVLLQMKSRLNTEGLLNIYYCLASYSHLSNNIVTWGVGKFINRVFVGQKRIIIRLIFNIRPMKRCENIFKTKIILTIRSIFLLKCVLYAFKHKHNSACVRGQALLQYQTWE